MYFLPSVTVARVKVKQRQQWCLRCRRRWSNANGRAAQIRDFLLPVGRLTKTSFRCKNFFAACNCCSRRSWYPNIRAACNVDSSIGPSSDIANANCVLSFVIIINIPSTLLKSKFRRKLPSSKIRDAGAKMFDNIPQTHLS